jgi:dihydroneopterin aldolase
MKEYVLNDIIRLKGITAFGHFGVSPQEREVGQKIQIDLTLYADLQAACSSDSLRDTINYESVYSKVIEIVTERKHQLIESLGEDICYEVLKEFPVSRVTISLRKLNLPFPNNLSHVEICLTREGSI